MLTVGQLPLTLCGMVLLIVIEFLLLALGLYGDARLIRHAWKHPDDRIVCIPAAVIVTALIGALGFVTLVTLAFAQCGENCFS